jgi:hypothetical protein
VVAKVRERLSVRKQAVQRFDVDRINLKKRYQTEYQGKYLKAKINKRPPCFSCGASKVILGGRILPLRGFPYLTLVKLFTVVYNHEHHFVSFCVAVNLTKEFCEFNF